MIVVLDPGPWAVLRDGGRYRQSHFGVSPSGAADPWSHQVANQLVGNPPTAEAFELTLHGGRFRFDAAVRFALAGADFGAMLDGEPVATWRSWRARRGQCLQLGFTREGARCYFAFRADDDSPLLRARARLSFENPATIRITPGADAALFAASLRNAFVAAEWKVSPHSDRHGLRLTAATAGHDFSGAFGERLTEGVTWGTVQLPPSGEPLVLMNDQQTTGGYPQLGQVIMADRPRLGQLKPGDHLRFHWTDPDSAVEVLAAQRRELQTVAVPL